MKFLITGAAGFLGSNLTSRLLADGHEVVGLDNLYTGSKANVEKFLGNKNYRFIHHDVTVPFYLDADGIFNLACPASPIHYQKYPVDTLKTSVMGAINSLELAKQMGARVLQASTSEVYGDPKVSPQNESYWGNVNPFGIRSCYDEGKRAAETLFFDYNKHFLVDIRIARIFNTYGPLMSKDDGRVVSNFILQALRNEDITIYGEGTQSRSFCYVDDLIDGLVKLFFADKANFPVNLGNPMPMTMIELANTVIELTNSNSKLIYKELPQDDPMVREPDIGKATSLLEWKPKVSLVEGLRKTIDYFAQELQI